MSDPSGSWNSLRLVSGLRREDEVVWQEFVDRFAPSALDLLRRTGLQPADAEDTLQELLLKVHWHIKGFVSRGPRTFRAWLRRILQNVVYDLRRHRSLRPLTDQESDDAADQDPDPTRALLLEELAEAVREALERARVRSPDGWEVYHLREHDGLPLREVAARLEVSYTNAGVRLHRFRACLREELVFLRLDPTAPDDTSEPAPRPEQEPADDHLP